MREHCPLSGLVEMNKTHCDGPNCDKTITEDKPTRAFGEQPWLVLFQEGAHTHHFHSFECLWDWTNQRVGK